VLGSAAVNGTVGSQKQNFIRHYSHWSPRWSIAPSGDRLKKQLRDLWRHHQEFNSIILSGYKCSSMVPGAEIDLTSIAVPYKSPSVPTSSKVVNSLVSAICHVTI